MRIEQFIRYDAPQMCGVNQAYGEMAWLSILAEQDGNPAFSRESFDSIDELVKIAFPYPEGDRDEEQYKRCFNLGKLIVLKHYSIGKHKEDHQAEMKKIVDERLYTVDELLMADQAAQSFWNG